MKQLHEALTELSAEQLSYVYHLWVMDDVVATQKLATNITKLVERSHDIVAARFVWQHLSQEQRQLMHRLVAPGVRKGIKYLNLHKRNEMNAQQFASVLDSLVQIALVSLEKPKGTHATHPKGKAVNPQEEWMVYPFKENIQVLAEVAAETLATSAVRAAMTLNDALEPVQQASLLLILQRFDVEYYPYASRVQLRTLISSTLQDITLLYEVLAKLNETERDLLKWLCTKGGHADIREIRAEKHLDDATLLPIFHKLADYALAFDMLASDGRLLFIPRDTYKLIKEALEHNMAPLPAAVLEPISETPSKIREGDARIQYDVAVIIGASYQQSLEPTKAGYIPKRVAAKIQPLLHGFPRYAYNNEDEYMEMLFTIAQELSLLQLSTPALQDMKEHYEPGKGLSSWSKSSLVKQTRLLLEQWKKSYRWYDLIDMDIPHDPYSWSPRVARELLPTFLKRCTPGKWYQIASLLEVIWHEEPLALRKSSFSYTYDYNNINYFGSGQQRKQRQPTGAVERAKWMSTDAKVYLGSLASSLFELGIVALGYDQQAVEGDDFAIPTTFMLTELGAAVLNEAASTELTMLDEQKSLVVQPSFELLLLAPNMPALYSVLPFAQVNQIERVSRLTLTRNSLLRGMYSGLSVEHMLSTLAQHSQKEVPQNVEYTIRDWTRQYKGLRLSQITLLEVSDEALAEELCTSSKFKSFEMRRLGPLAVAASGDINTLRHALDKEGINVNIITSGKAKPKAEFTFGMPR